MTVRYTHLAVTLHWLIALLILANVALAWIWPVAADDQVRPMIDAHKSIGITVLGLAVMRLLWRAVHRPPPLPAGYAGWEKTASHLVHWLLYLVMFGLPLTGWIMDSAWKDAASHPMAWFGLFEWPRIGWVMALDPDVKERFHDVFGEGHEIAAKALYLLVILHVGGALKHQFLDREKELQRIWFDR